MVRVFFESRPLFSFYWRILCVSVVNHSGIFSGLDPFLSEPLWETLIFSTKHEKLNITVHVVKSIKATVLCEAVIL